MRRKKQKIKNFIVNKRTNERTMDSNNSKTIFYRQPAGIGRFNWEASGDGWQVGKWLCGLIRDGQLEELKRALEHKPNALRLQGMTASSCAGIWAISIFNYLGMVLCEANSVYKTDRVLRHAMCILIADSLTLLCKDDADKTTHSFGADMLLKYGICADDIELVEMAIVNYGTTDVIDLDEAEQKRIIKNWVQTRRTYEERKEEGEDEFVDKMITQIQLIKKRKVPSVDAEKNHKKKKEAEAEADDDDQCVICMVASQTTVFVPCAHRVCCAKCADAMLGKPCPMCRIPIAELIVGGDDYKRAPIGEK